MAELIFDVGASKEDFIFMPACCYAGNQFKVIKKKYPPMFLPEEASVDMDTVITDVPRLNEDGSGRIEVTTGDVAVPCIGVFSKERQKGFLVFTVQEIQGQNLGLAYEQGKMIITYPAKRTEVYMRFRMWENKDEAKDAYKYEEVEIPYRFLEFDCADIEHFYEVFFENRKIMGMNCGLPQVLSKEEQFRIQVEKFNQHNWHEKGEFYTTGVSGNKYDTWQPGWVGGGMLTYAFLKMGGPLEKARSVKTLQHLFKFQGKSGLFYGGCDNDLVKYGDGFNTPGTDDWCLLRKSADVLFFVLRQFELLEEVPAVMSEGIRKCADAFVKLWTDYGQLGQFVDAESGKIVVGGSASAAIAPAGLVLAYRYFEDITYLQAAKEIAEYYYNCFVRKGYTTGGPGEILQCPDSESAFGLLESCVWLYEETKEERFLEFAQNTAYLCSSWVVSYNYKFPAESEFGRLDMKTVGSVIANIQNKHSAPGICTLSGTSLRKLYEWTGKKKFLEMYREITETISQYMSTEERPVHAMDGRALPPGFMCERVNMSDWESQSWVGGLFYGSCWCEVSNLLVLAEM